MTLAINPTTTLAALARHIGAANGVTADQLAYEILHQQPHEAELRALREAVVYLRLEGHHVCAHPSAGYYVAESAEELDDTCAFLYERAMTSLKQVAAMKRVSLPDLRGQLKLPT